MSLIPHLLGKDAEVAAERFLRRKGYTILDRNVRFGRGELDIVARVGKMLVFVEVKARSTEHYGGVFHAVTAHKERQLIHLAAQYLARHQCKQSACRFDVLLYDATTPGAPVLEHIEHAFEVSGDDLRW